jgi:2-polyprenyl-3-methyl-5-hydroxy-6-metoxy-1,4-benzoquinol methylase
MSEPVIEYVSSVTDTKFPDDWYELANAEHFWMHWRQAVALRMIDSTGLERDRELRAFDIGCGAGLFRDQLEGATSWIVDATDLNLAALRQVKPGRGRTLYYDVTEEAGDLLGSYDVVFLFDVIEHVEDVRGLLASAIRHLRPGGHLFINVPALQALFSAYDVAAGHLRRYSRKTLEAELSGLPCRPGPTHYWGFGLLPLLVARRLLVGRQPTEATIRTGFRPPSRLVNQALKAISKIELRLLKYTPLGTSVMGVARRHFP